MSVYNCSFRVLPVLITGLFKNIWTLFSNKTPNAAQAWHLSDSRASHLYWLFCAPVHLLLGRDSFFLTAPAPIEVSEVDANALMQSLNLHFAARGYHFYLQNNSWFLGLDHDPQITTTSIACAENKDVSAFLPQGDGALAWATLQNEIQMLLFSHPVNEQREKDGKPVVNSLWCYGLS